MSEMILKIEKLNKWFGVTHANRDIDFTLNRGEIRGLIGENGSGKSTLTSQICGIQQPTSGKMFLNGQEYAPASPLEANQRQVSMVVQELGVLGTLPRLYQYVHGTHAAFYERRNIGHSRDQQGGSGGTG